MVTRSRRLGNNQSLSEETTNTQDVEVGSDAQREREYIDYRDGGKGFCRWVEDMVWLEVYPYDSVHSVWMPGRELPRDKNPKTGKSYWDMWCEQKKIMEQALRMENERFVHRQIVFCWMRGEGKSVDAVLIQLWKFFCWTRQKIMLGANSRDQIKFVHYDIMRDIIWNSPELYHAVGKKNIQEKEIRITNRYGETTSIIRSISSFTGILSNITGYTFSEMFDMKNPKFYTQLDGSIRNIPNALGVIDSTVSDKSHVLYQLYTGFTEKKTRLVFFSHRQSPLGDPGDYWNPNMDEDQLNDYKVKFPLGDFERYFLNTWEAGRILLFDDRMIEETLYIGMDNSLLEHKPMQELIEKKLKLKQRMEGILDKGFTENAEVIAAEIAEINTRFRHTEELFQISYGPEGAIEGASLHEIQQMSELFDTDWAVMAGIDFADPMAIQKKARTIYTLVLKGLPGSRQNPHVFDMENAALKYIYILIRLVDVTDHTVNSIKTLINADHEQLDGIDTLCSERYGS